MGWMRFLLPVLLAAALIPIVPASADSASPTPTVHYVRWDGPIGPVAARYLSRRIEQAEKAGAELIIIGLDTPGGLDTSMRTIVRAINDAEIPVAVWVGPSGSRAASAGCVIGLAAPILAMAPGTNIGAAHPVSVGGGLSDSTMAEKVAHDAAAYVEALAHQRGRNESWARDSVLRSLSVSADEAVRLKVADFIAADVEALVRATDSRTVRTRTGEVTLHPSPAHIVTIRRDWQTDLLAVVNDPNIGYILLLLGVYGLFFELANPGSLFPGIFGLISLILGLYSMSSLPVNGAGLLLVVAGIVMLLLEIKITSHGLLAVGGIAALLSGSLLLVNSSVPAFRLSLSVVLPAVTVTSAFFLWLVGKGMAAQRRPPKTGVPALLGRRGQVRTRLSPTGTVFVEGTHWTAKAEGGDPIEVDRQVRVVGVEGLHLTVRPEE